MVWWYKGDDPVLAGNFRWMFVYAAKRAIELGIVCRRIQECVGKYKGLFQSAQVL